MQKLARMKAKQPQKIVASAQQEGMQKSPMCIKTKKPQQKPKQQYTSSSCSSQSQTSHAHSGGTVLDWTGQRREGYRDVHSKLQKDHKISEKQNNKGIAANANTQNGSKDHQAEETIAGIH